jgi:hypothetical protein
LYKIIAVEDIDERRKYPENDNGKTAGKRR